jgi:dTDP-4-amino-4,6-dideoxygalactose transaminase
MPNRIAMGESEKAMLKEALDFYEAEGLDPGYQGVFEKKYTDNFVEYMGGGYADAVATGTGAVFIAIAALKLPKGSEVIVSPITDPGTLSAIILNNLIPRLADSKPGSYNMGVQQVVERLTKNVSAILVVHSIGQAAEIKEIAELAKQNNIFLVEDCSQAHGAKLLGRPVGTFGDIAAFSTMYRKIHIAGGSGGVVYSRDLGLFRSALAFADRGKPRWQSDFNDRDPSNYLYPALNWNTDELSCAIGVASLKRLNDTIIKRLSYVSELAAYIAEMDTVFKLYPWTPCDAPFILPVYVDMSRIEISKESVAEAVKSEGIPLNPHYAYVVSDWAWIKPFMADDFKTINAINARNNSFCLYLNENYSSQEALDTAAALLKVSRAIAKASREKKQRIIPIAQK